MNPNQSYGNMPQNALISSFSASGIPNTTDPCVPAGQQLDMDQLMAPEMELLGPAPTYGQPVASVAPTSGQQSPDYTGKPKLHIMGQRQQVVQPILPQQLDQIPLETDLLMEQDWNPSPSPPPAKRLNSIHIPQDNGEHLSERDVHMAEPMHYPKDEPILQLSVAQPLPQPRHQHLSGWEYLPAVPQDQQYAFQIRWHTPPQAQADPPSPPAPQDHHQLPGPSAASTAAVPAPSTHPSQHRADNDTTAMTLFLPLKSTINSTEVALSHQTESPTQPLPYSELPDVHSYTTAGDPAMSCSHATMCLQGAQGQARVRHFARAAAAQ